MLARTLTLLLSVYAGAVVAADTDLVLPEEQQARSSGKSVVIELEDKNDDSSVEKAVKKSKKPGKQRVEMIVGGQGEDGIAKRGSLIIEK